MKTDEHKTLSEQEFDENYTLIPNPFNPFAGWTIGDGPGYLFETYGEELAYVRNVDPRRVWTLLENDDGNPYILSGLRFVNRIGHFVSEELVPDHFIVQVRLSTIHEE
jgi:hypothetical protein